MSDKTFFVFIANLFLYYLFFPKDSNDHKITNFNNPDGWFDISKYLKIQNKHLAKKTFPSRYNYKKINDELKSNFIKLFKNF